MAAALTLRCTTGQEVTGLGEPVLVAVSIRNDGDAPLTLSAVGVPWMFHGSIKFEADGLEQVLPVIDPPEATLELAPREEKGGSIDLTQHLSRPDGKVINEEAGDFKVSAMVTAVVLKTGEDPPYERVPLSCGPFTVKIEG